MARRSRSTASTRRRFPVRLTPRVRRIALVAVLAAGAFGVAALLASWEWACAGNSCPAITELGKYDPDQTAKVYFADGRLITELGAQRRTVVPLDEISPAVIAAFVTTEDKRFYQHHGIDWYRVFGAVKANVLKMRVAEGFSTITMQLVRNVWSEDIGRDKSLRRKLREAKVAMDIERHLSKEKILELYLNQIPLGNRAFGIEAAAQRYFGKSARNLNVAEAATLAAIPKAPSTYDPRRNPARNVQRRNTVLNLMRDNGLLTAADAERWKAYPLLLSSHSDYSGTAEYFIEYIRAQLEARFPDLYTSGYRIYTTLDLDMQQAAERALSAQLEAIENGAYGAFPHPTYQDYLDHRADKGGSPGNSAPYLQGLTVSIEAKTGYIRAMVGGRDFEDNKFNRATQALRQPGSTFKPIVYAAAVEAGYPLSYVVDDSPVSIPDPTDSMKPPWEPQNYELDFDGPMTLRQALYRSRNTVAVKLGMALGEQAVISEAAKFGLTTPVPPYPSIFIGSAEVIPLEIIAGYTAFANLGVRAVPNAILRVEDPSGRIVWQPPVRTAVVMDSAEAWLMTDVLRDVVRRGTAYRAVGSQLPELSIGGKTGTTNDGNDVWFIGFTPDIVTGVWIGFDQPKKIKANAGGGVLAAPAWTAMMREIYERRPVPTPWPRPAGLTVLEIDAATGYKATPLCPRESRVVESFLPGTEPTMFCPIHLPFGADAGVMGGRSPLYSTPLDRSRLVDSLRRTLPLGRPLPPPGGVMGGLGPPPAAPPH